VHSHINPVCLQAEEAGLPPLPDAADLGDMKLRMAESVLTTLAGEEATGAARLTTELDDNLGEEERRQICDKTREHIVGGT